MVENTEEQPAQNRQSSLLLWTLYLVSLALALLAQALGWFDRTTLLAPSHAHIDQACMAIAVLCGVVFCALAIRSTCRLSLVQRIVLPLLLLFLSSLGAFMMAEQCASLLVGRMDFPAGKTHTRTVLLMIERAYQTHGKGSSQYIQTTPIWSNLEIAPQDFAFMQQHRSPADDGRNPHEISSKGYFCAQVTIEETDKAVRILHAGAHPLPAGSILPCPFVHSQQ